MKRPFRYFIALGLLAASVVWAAPIPDRYVVELSGAPASMRIAARGRRVSPLIIAPHRTQVQSEQRPTRLAIAQQGGEVLETMDTVTNAVIVRIPSGQAAGLARILGVRSVRPERRFKMLLDRAVVVNKVVEAWNLVGLSSAGAGIKIAIIDTGIDVSHPGFQDPSLAVPSGFPKVNEASDTSFTNNKVIVARSYASMFDSTDPDPSANDQVGHGTATAMIAAGVLNSGPRATIRGVAPKAWLGNYKVFGSPNVNDTAPEGAILKAMDDAVADGMDVINLSLGDAEPSVLADDTEVQAISQAVSMGVIVVVAGGNAGPDLHTLGSPASAPLAITVGASANDRRFGGSATVGGTRYFAIPGSGPTPSGAVTGPLKDVTTLGDNGLACSAFPAGSLNGRIAFIARGVCFFSEKLNNVQAAGAVGALVYTDEARPAAIEMSVNEATLPATMVSYPDGILIKNRLAANPSLTATLDFTVQPSLVDPDHLADFSSKGPNVDNSIKPDLVAVGTTVYTAAQKTNPDGDVYDPSGYLTVDGTSFSAPMVAGTAALLKAARPGLTVAQYRSLIINTAAPVSLIAGIPARAQQAGAGNLDAGAAVRATAAETPTSVTFGVGTGDVQQTRTLSISNVGAAAETFTLTATQRNAPTGFVAPGSRTAVALETIGKIPSVTLSNYSLTLNPGASANVTVRMTGFGLSPGAYEGFIYVLGSKSGVEERVAYWYGVPSGVAANITVLDTVDNATPGAFVPNAVLFRVTDANGITVAADPQATVISGGGTVVSVVNRNASYPGVYALTARMGPAAGDNVFRIQVGSLTKDVTITTE
jgi:subtilisin family serine protease